MSFAIIGAGLGLANSLFGGGDQQTASKEPWSAAAPWLKDNLAIGKALQGYYQKNPFNQQQMTGYQNLFSDVDNYRNAVSPGLLAITNKYLNKGGSPGVSLLSSGTPGKADAGGYAPMARSFGLLDFDGMNPFKNGAIDLEKMEAERRAKEEREAEEQRRRTAAESNGERFA